MSNKINHDQLDTKNNKFKPHYVIFEWLLVERLHYTLNLTD